MSYDICIVSAKKHAQMAWRLAEGMRKYRLPRGIVPVNPLDHRNILLDTEETPFTEETMAILNDVGYLIVLFSPEARASDAVNDKLVYYEKLTGRESIVPVIADGEPADIFPPMFIQHRTVQRILPDMSVVEMEETIEPVAADLRGETPKRCRELLQYETVRIVASVLGLHPDDLERRHAKRRKKRLIAAVSALGTIFLSVTVLFSYLGIKAYREGIIARQQTEEATRAVVRLTEELPALFDDEPEALAYVQQAISEASDALEQGGLLLQETEE